MTGPLIIVDWGTSSFRAWLVDSDGTVRDEIPDGHGMRALRRDQFAAYFSERLGRWRQGEAPPPVYLAGMVGAPQGWQTAPQPILPMTPDRLAAQVIAVDGVAGAYIVPGVRRQEGPADIDVMRGEEVQIFGALALAGRRGGVLCLPGTHSKWARVEDGALTTFTTSMTGEVFELMLAHSVLRLTADQGAPFSPAGFDAGLDQAAREGGLLHHLFTTRARGLYGDLGPAVTESYLSGVLIGSEFASMLPLYPEAGSAEVLLVCAPQLRLPYERAFRRRNPSCRWIPARDATIRGVCEIARYHQAAQRSEKLP